MGKQKDSLAIKKVDADTFDDFLGLIDKLAEFEKLAPPDEEARKRLRADYLSDKPKYEAFVGKIGDKWLHTRFTSSLIQAFLLCPLSSSRTSLFLKNIEDVGLARKFLTTAGKQPNAKDVAGLNFRF